MCTYIFFKMSMHFSRWRNVAFATGAAILPLLLFNSAVGLRRMGLLGDYGRVCFVARDTCRVELEAGCIPQNVFLPPHLRPDQRSYLDKPDTEIAVPPIMDAGTSPFKRRAALEGELPADEMEVTPYRFGPIHGTWTKSFGPSMFKYADRSFPVPEEKRKTAQKVQAEKDMIKLRSIA